jgi:hypothetical protein
MGLGVEAPRDDAERALYRDRFTGVMRLWAWDGLGLHMVLFVLASFVTPWFRGAFGAVCLFFLGPQNLFTAYVMWKERRIERALQAELKRTAPADSTGTVLP